MRQALQYIAFEPFGYLIDKWRWDVFRREITPANYNDAWWKLRYKHETNIHIKKNLFQEFDVSNS